MPISFKTEIADIEAALREERAELQKLEAQWKQYDVELAGVHEALETLRTATSGGTPTTRQVNKVVVSPETGRPPRGARRDQLSRICRQLGRGGKSFRTLDVLNRVREVDGDVSPGVRSYTYSSMNTFVAEGLIEKVGRGKWKLQ